ncbi:MAG: radical SAM protein, partial [Elusimicrobia bacterium RIFOXYB2_FULL_49_7]
MLNYIYIILKSMNAFSPYLNCTLCPRECRVNRFSGQVGYCGQAAELRIASIGPHFGEEPPISGNKGSGTIFFSGCSTGCFFCQNYQISKENLGQRLSPSQLETEVLELIQRGVHNINFVTPDHFWPHIKGVAEFLKQKGVTIPLLINGSGYHKKERVLEMAEVCDIFLPDMKFADSVLAKYCMGREDYPIRAMESITLMVEKKGFLDTWFDDKDETCPPATKGVLVRHLVLPG